MMNFKKSSKKVILIPFFLTVLFSIGIVVIGTQMHTMPVEIQKIKEDKNTIEKRNDSISSSGQQPTQTVVYEETEIRQYTGENAHPYIHDIRTNNTDHKIVATECGMMAFDKEGNPLMIKWNGMDSDAEPSYYYLYDWDTAKLEPQQTEDVFGGWSLNWEGTDFNVPKIEYVLYCDKKITFDHGMVWENPDFEKWRSTYEGKKISVDTLKNYYPFEHSILTNN